METRSRSQKGAFSSWRRRWFVAVLSVGVVACTGLPQAGASTQPVILWANRVAGAHFGERLQPAVATLNKTLGLPSPRAPIAAPHDCNVTSVVFWPSLTGYFFRGRFVGYSTVPLGRGPSNDPLERTAAGLRLGDSLSLAKHIYGSALSTSSAQGGAWFAKTPQGRLEGFLSAEPNRHGAKPRIETIEAGAVGCPALSP